MERIGVVNQREIFYLQQRECVVWQNKLPGSNWLLFAVAHEEDVQRINELSERCLDKNVSYICGAGHIGNTIEDAFDLELINRKIKNSEHHDSFSEELPVTTWHDDFDEGFWFAATAANHSVITIDKVVCVILGKRDYKKRLQELINKINEGWFPDR